MMTRMMEKDYTVVFGCYKAVDDIQGSVADARGSDTVHRTKRSQQSVSTTAKIL